MATQKSQVSAELLILISMMLVIFLVVFSVSNARHANSLVARKNLYARIVGDSFANEINSLYFAGHGSNKTVFLPGKLRDNTPYNLTIFPEAHLVVTTWQTGEYARQYSSSLLTANLTGELSGINYPVNLSNTGGVINIGS